MHNSDASKKRTRGRCFTSGRNFQKRANLAIENKEVKGPILGGAVGLAQIMILEASEENKGLIQVQNPKLAVLLGIPDRVDPRLCHRFEKCSIPHVPPIPIDPPAEEERRGFVQRPRTRKNGHFGPTESTSYRGKIAFCDQRYQKVKGLLKTKGNAQNAGQSREREQEGLHDAAFNRRDGQRSEIRRNFAMLTPPKPPEGVQ